MYGTLGLEWSMIDMASDFVCDCDCALCNAHKFEGTLSRHEEQQPFD